MPLVRLSEKTDAKIPLVKKELIRNKPDFEQMNLSKNFLVNRAIDFYLLGTPFKLREDKSGK